MMPCTFILALSLGFARATLDSISPDCKGLPSEEGLCENNSSTTNNSSRIIEEAAIPLDEGFECGIYLAPSTIPNAGFGVFTTRSIGKNHPIQPYSESPSIIVADFYEPSGNEEQDWNHVDYIWEPVGFAAFEAVETSVSVMTFGSLCNYHPVLKNVSPDSATYDDTLLDRFKDPGAGAISYHNGNVFLATRDIDAGEEIFADYGRSWLDQRPGTFADHVPRKADYETAAKVFSTVNEENHQFHNDSQLSIVADVMSVLDRRAATLFPKTTAVFQDIVKDIVKYNEKHEKNKGSKGDISKPRLARIIARNNLEKRGIEWIKSNGICLEKIRPGPSTIAGAGRGAFAQVLIKSSEIIAPAPLLNVASKDSILMYQSEEHDQPSGQQLLINYCFSHKNVDLVLCPQTNSVLINHCSKRDPDNQCNDGKGPNAVVRWADSWDPSTAEWLTKTVDEIRELTASGSRGLTMEFIATRDIAPGEEIFIDYGRSWEDAWSSHVKSWMPPQSNEASYTPVMHMNKKDIRSKKELETNPYPDNMALYCYGGRIVDGDLTSHEKDTGVVNGDEDFDGDKDELDEYDNLLPCAIKEKEYDNNSKKYVVEMIHENNKYVVEAFPRRSVSLRMKRYSSDQFMENTFRHFIEIDDGMVPEQWLQSEE